MANTQFGGGMEKRENVVFPYLVREREKSEKNLMDPQILEK